MVAFHYPPFQGSSGVLRTLTFSKYLPEFGWEPWVLTANERVYARVQTAEPGGLAIPAGVHVVRAFALDAAKDLAIRGRYLSWLALPDRWSSWCLPATYRALRIVRKHRPNVLWSTFPIPSAHIVAGVVKRLTGLPWIADFRDSMTEDEYPTDPRVRRIYRRIETSVVKGADRVVFTTEGTRRMYEARYPEIDRKKWTVLPNGYDEQVFARAEAARAPASDVRDTRITLVHSGILYPVERDPRPFFAAVGALKRQGAIDAQSVRIVLRATSHDDIIRPMLMKNDIEDIVSLERSIPYERALREMMDSSALLLFQAANSNHQIPAKLYEYMRAGRPILALTDAHGDTAAVLRSVGAGTLADIADADDIAARLSQFLEALQAGTARIVEAEVARQFSRQSRTGELVQLLQSLDKSRS